MESELEEFEHSEWDMSSAELRRLSIDPDIPIHRDNAPILTFPEDHPARKTLIAQAVCRRDCACREIDWPDSNHVGIDQEWQSATDEKLWTFSSFVYACVSFSLILEGWLTQPAQLAEDELHGLEIIPKALNLLNECETAALKAENQAILDLIPIPRSFFILWQEAINLRIQGDPLSENKLL